MKKPAPVDVERVGRLANELAAELERPATENNRESDKTEKSRASRTDPFRASGSKHAIM